LKSCCVLQDHYDDERDKIVFHNTTQNLQDHDQDQENSVQDQDQDRFFWSETGLVLRPTVSDHFTVMFVVLQCLFNVQSINQYSFNYGMT